MHNSHKDAHNSLPSLPSLFSLPSLPSLSSQESISEAVNAYDALSLYGAEMMAVFNADGDTDKVCGGE